jgi:hypothetical protein
VIDINDHAPAFQQEVYTATLSEAAPVGSFVAAPQVQCCGTVTIFYGSVPTFDKLRFRFRF